MIPKAVITTIEATEETAARWALLYTTPGFCGSAAMDLERWLDQDQGRRQAFGDALATLRALDTHSGAPGLMSLRQAALSARPVPRVSAAPLVLGGLLAASVIVVVLGVFSTTLGSSPLDAPNSVFGHFEPSKRYQTAVGERAIVSLSDGSVMTLDTGSQVEVRYSQHSRKIILLSGQALFEVAKHQKRPFEVYAANQRVTALGTKFNVRLDAGRLRLTLLEGRVRVDKPGMLLAFGARPSLQLTPGEVLETHADDTIRIRSADVAETAGWRDGVLIFEDQTLTEAVREMNRYTTLPIRLAPQIGERYRLSGVYKTGDSERFAQTLTELFPLKLTYTAGGEPALTPR